jgi:D-arabinose 1-dehydrogenase
MVSLDETLPPYDVPDVSNIPDDAQDLPVAGSHLVRGSKSLTIAHDRNNCTVYVLQTPLPCGIPPLVFGAASLSAHYNSDDHLRSDVPFRTVRLALR